MTKLFRKTEYDLKDKLSLPIELDDFKEVLLQAARSGKYPPNDWLKPDGKKQDIKTQYKSISHHMIDGIEGALKGELAIDKDSGLASILHAICRLNMLYVRLKRGIIHPLDTDDFTDYKEYESSRPNPLIKRGNEVNCAVVHERVIHSGDIPGTNLTRSGNEQHNTKYYSGQEEISKEQYDDIVVTRSRIYQDLNKGAE